MPAFGERSLTPTRDRRRRPLRARGRCPAEDPAERTTLRGHAPRARSRPPRRDGRPGVARIGVADDRRDARRPGRRRRARRRGHGLLAGRGRPRRPRRREEDASRARRPAATGSRPARCTSSTTWASAEPARPSSTATTACGPSPTASPSSCAWPEHPVYPRYGYVVRRRDLDQMVAEHAVKAGRHAAAGHRGGRARSRRRPRARRGRRSDKDDRRDARGPGPLRGGRRRRQLALRPGARHRAATATYPQGMAIRGYFESPLHDEPWIESAPRRPRPRRQLAARLRLDLPGGRRHGQRRHRPAVDVPRLEVRQHHAPDGRVRRDRARRTGSISPETVAAARRPAAGCRWAARSTRRSARPGSSSATPPARSTRSTARASTTRTRPAAWPPTLLDEALRTGDGLALQQLPAAARRRVRPLLQGGAAVRQGDRQPGAHARAHPRRHAVSRTLMEWVLRIMANLLRPDELGPAEAAYKAAAAIVRVVPEPASCQLEDRFVPAAAIRPRHGPRPRDPTCPSS